MGDGLHGEERSDALPRQVPLDNYMFLWHPDASKMRCVHGRIAADLSQTRGKMRDSERASSRMERTQKGLQLHIYMI